MGVASELPPTNTVNVPACVGVALTEGVLELMMLFAFGAGVNERPGGSEPVTRHDAGEAGAPGAAATTVRVSAIAAASSPRCSALNALVSAVAS